MRFRRFRILSLMVIIALVGLACGAVIESHNRRAWQKFAALEEEFTRRAAYYRSQADYCWQREDAGLPYDQAPFWPGSAIRSWGDEAAHWETQSEEAQTKAEEYHKYRADYESRLLWSW